MRGYVQAPAAGKGWAGDNGGPKAQSLGLAATRFPAGSESPPELLPWVVLGMQHIAETGRRTVGRESGNAEKPSFRVRKGNGNTLSPEETEPAWAEGAERGPGAGGWTRGAPRAGCGRSALKRLCEEGNPARGRLRTEILPQNN